MPKSTPTTFTTILADPPWPAQSGERHYQTMSLDQIKALPVGDLAAENAHLWLWTTNALLREAYAVSSPGFCRGCFIWLRRLPFGGCGVWSVPAGVGCERCRVLLGCAC